MQKPNYSADVERKRLVRLIHVAKRDLGMAEDAYRDALRAGSGGKDSSSAMTIPELEKTLSHFKRCGFKIRAKAKPSRPLAQHPEDKKIRALWLFLHELGVVNNPSEEALAGYVKRITKVDALQWINGDQSLALIESLKKWAQRYLPGKIKEKLAVLEQAVAEGRLEVTEQEAWALNGALAEAWKRESYDPQRFAWDTIATLLKNARPAAGAAGE